jgi:hypothetical protein
MRAGLRIIKITVLTILVAVAIFVVGASALVFFDEFRESHPSKLLCGKLILRQDDALKEVAESIVSWPSEALGGITAREYVSNNTSSCCSADLKDEGRNWLVSVSLPTKCKTVEQYIVKVRVCGGGTSRIGSSPMSYDNEIISSTLSPTTQWTSNSSGYCR